MGSTLGAIRAQAYPFGRVLHLHHVPNWISFGEDHCSSPRIPISGWHLCCCTINCIWSNLGGYLGRRRQRESLGFFHSRTLRRPSPRTRGQRVHIRRRSQLAVVVLGSDDVCRILLFRHPFHHT